MTWEPIRSGARLHMTSSTVTLPMRALSVGHFCHAVSKLIMVDITTYDMQRDLSYRPLNWIEVKRTIPARDSRVDDVPNSSTRDSTLDAHLVCDEMFAMFNIDHTINLQFLACFQEHSNGTFRKHPGHDIALCPDQILNFSSSQWYPVEQVTGSLKLDASARVQRNTCGCSNPTATHVLAPRVSLCARQRNLPPNVQYPYVRSILRSMCRCQAYARVVVSL
jgi:hypothetical protein